MKIYAIVFFVFGLFAVFPTRADDVPLVVVSCRQYLIKGASTIHLYLYDLRGKLRKQLTSEPGQDDHQPLFSHDGKRVLFTRDTTGAGLPNQSGKYIMEISTGALTRLPEGPGSEATLQEFAPTIDTTDFNDLAFSDKVPGEADPAFGEGALVLAAPDKKTKLIRINSPDPDAPPTYKLQMADAAQPRSMSSFRGYVKCPDNIGGDQYLTGKSGPFLVGPDHYGALFMDRHRDSMWVFDLETGKFGTGSSRNGFPVIFSPQKTGQDFIFYDAAWSPLGDTNKAVLSAYLEWWDAKFEHVLLSPPLSVSYGAATYYGSGKTSAFADEQRGS